jgi:aspartate-semialdehyde dehydrogenase
MDVAGRIYRIGIVGASSLAGKELIDALAESSLAASDIVLLDDDSATGQLMTSGDEVTVIQKIEAESFAGLDFVFFAGDAAAANKHWKAARAAGASLVDMTYALEREPGTVVRAPWVRGSQVGGEDETAANIPELDLTTQAVVAAHPAALMLLIAATRLRAKFVLRAISATVFEPASEHGRAAMDELHQQTVSLLSFQSLPREQYDAQVAFNLLPSLGEEAKVNLNAARERIAAHFSGFAGSAMPELALQLLQAPVFHGYVVSALIELSETATVAQVELAVFGEHVDVVAAESDPPSNISAAGQGDVLFRISAADGGHEASSRFWLWMAADNLKLAALNGIACAVELGRLRPQGIVQ